MKSKDSKPKGYKLYKGSRVEESCNVLVTNSSGKTYNLPSKIDLVKHNTCFNWGDSGSGASQLALAIVSDLTGDDIYTMAHYKELRDLVISKLSKDTWEMTEPELREFV